VGDSLQKFRTQIVFRLSCQRILGHASFTGGSLSSCLVWFGLKEIIVDFLLDFDLRIHCDVLLREV